MFWASEMDNLKSMGAPVTRLVCAEYTQKFNKSDLHGISCYGDIKGKGVNMVWNLKQALEVFHVQNA